MNPRIVTAILAAVTALLAAAPATAQTTTPIPSPAQLPRTIDSGTFPAGHIQGIAVDTQRRYIYYSYTTMLVKADMQGRVVGTVTGLLGHLGCLDFNDADGRLYGSLEYKNDAIGRGILAMQGSDGAVTDGFYVAIFDVDRITRDGMDAERDGIMTAVFLGDVLDDYKAEIDTADGTVAHRYGCSGIDGISFGPRFGRNGGRQYLTIAYGIYGDTNRTDNDYQVLLQYDTRDWSKYERQLSQSTMHRSGPAQADGRYFVFTGNTTYGVQNLEYDAASRCWFMTVYAGKKTGYPNYTLFAADGAARPVKRILEGVPYARRGYVVPLAQAGLQDGATGIRGWRFGYGATGLCSLGDGYFYISHDYRNADGQGSVIRLYRLTGDAEQPFKAVE